MSRSALVFKCQLSTSLLQESWSAIAAASVLTAIINKVVFAQVPHKE